MRISNFVVNVFFKRSISLFAVKFFAAAAICLVFVENSAHSQGVDHAPNNFEKTGSKQVNEVNSLAELDNLVSSVERITLSNGLKVLFLRRDYAPIFVGQLWVKVGGVNEVTGKTGVSHLLEHMAFKGTRTIGTKDYGKEESLLARLDAVVIELDELKGKLLVVDASATNKATNSASAAELKGKAEKLAAERKEIEAELSKLWNDNEFSQIYQQVGAKGLNAATSKDYTYYTIELPNVAFELWCYLESERLLDPVYRQFYTERAVVEEERRMRVTDNPAGLMYESLLGIGYLSHPNRFPVIGYSSDLANLHVDDLKALQQNYYRPDNMVLSIVGDLESRKIAPLLERYFGRLPVSNKPLPGVATVEPMQKGERVAKVEYQAEPQLMAAYHKPAHPHVDDSYFAVLHALLADGRSSILVRELIEEKKLATSIYTTEAPGELFPSLFFVGAVPQSGVGTEVLLNEIQAIFDRLKENTVSDEAIKYAKRRVRVGVLSALDSSSGIASMMGKSELLWGDLSVLIKVYRDVEGATPVHIRELVRKYLKVSNRSVVHLTKVE